MCDLAWSERKKKKKKKWALTWLLSLQHQQKNKFSQRKLYFNVYLHFLLALTHKIIDEQQKE